MIFFRDPMLIWHEQSNRYNTELWHFKKQTAEFIKGINQDHGTLRQDLEWMGVWVDCVEREMDYVETQNPASACVNQADRMVDVDQEVKERLKERKKGGEEEDGYSRVSDCVDIISRIRAMKILKRMGSPKGMWTIWRYGAHTSLKYKPQEKQIYTWDDGYQILYKLSMKRKLMV
ncbi:unnamed protein product [Coregonus sp. 'balchen']|nr:unnamed protein product [Coregonus sp. 'balchen']